MKTRIIVGTVLSLLLVSVLYFGGLYYIIVMTLFSIAAVHEMGKLLRVKGFNPSMPAAYLFSAAYGFLYFYLGLTAVACFFLACLLASICCVLMRRNACGGDAFATLSIFCYPIVLLVCLLLSYAGFERSLGLTTACLAMATPACADTFAYFGGTLLGKHKLCPAISPKKTVEGGVFALLGGISFGAILIPLQRLWGGTVSVGLLLGIGLLCGFFAQVGDLLASLLKRWAGIKDFSTIFPGHGGIMDRIDSVLACSAVVVVCFTILTRLGIY